MVPVPQMDGILVNGIDITYQTALDKASEQHAIPTINPLTKMGLGQKQIQQYQ